MRSLQSLHSLLKRHWSVPNRVHFVFTKISFSTCRARQEQDHSVSATQSLFERNIERIKSFRAADTVGPRKSKDLESTTVIVRNIDAQITEDDLWQRLEGLGPIRGLWIRRTRTGESREFAVVEFETPKAAARVLELRSRMSIVLNNRQLRIHRSIMQNLGSHPQWLFVTNLPDDAEKADVLGVFSQFEPIEIEMHYGGQLGRYSRVRFASADSACEVYSASASTPFSLNGIQLYLSPDGWVRTPRTSPLLCISNMPLGTGQLELRKLFEEFGTVKSIHFPSTQPSTQYAYVRFDSRYSATRVWNASRRKTNPFTLGENVIRVEPLLNEAVATAGDLRQLALWIREEVPPLSPSGLELRL